MVGPAYVGVMLLQGAIVGTLLIGLRRENVSAVVNAAVAFVTTLVPVLVETVLGSAVAGGLVVGPALPLWIATAGLLHSIGMLGLYESTSWWDHLTHAVSAALVAALVYAGIIVTVRHSPGGDIARGVIVVITLVFTGAVGTFWEVIELVARDVGDRYGIEPILVHYGWRDTVFDLGFDFLGALVVLLLDFQLFVPVLDQIPDITRLLLMGIGGVVVVGGLLMGIVIGLVNGPARREE